MPSIALLLWHPFVSTVLELASRACPNRAMHDLLLVIAFQERPSGRKGRARVLKATR